jgi:hypothetical protein
VPSVAPRPTASILGAVLALGLAAACADSTPLPTALPTAPPASLPAAPVTPVTPVAPAEWAPAPPFPALTRPGTIYAAADSVYDSAFSVQYHGSRLGTRYVFYEDGTFGLQFSSANHGFFEYRGRYVQTDARVTFDWDGWSTAGPWGATGALRGDTLTVSYNVVMMLTDFVDGVYLRAPDAP